VFNANLFTSIDHAVISAIKDIVNRMENLINSSALKEKCQAQGELALEEAKVCGTITVVTGLLTSCKAELSKLVATVSGSLQTQQKEISRRIAPTVKDALHSGYSDAVTERGRGSVARQKVRIIAWQACAV